MASPLPWSGQALPLLPHLTPISLHTFSTLISLCSVSLVALSALSCPHAHPTAFGCPLLTLESQLEATLSSSPQPRYCTASLP